MKSRRVSLTHSVFFTVAVAVALSNSAFADGGRAAALFAESKPEASFETALPTSLGQWSEAADEIDLADAHGSISIADFLPQGRLKTQPPFIDFTRWEIGGFIGLAAFSSDFEADPDWVFGLTTRIPLPGVPLGDWGVWGEFLVGNIRRDIPFYYDNSHGQYFALMAGADYTLITTELLYLRAQLGVMYANWNDIAFLDNGAGVIVGAEFGFFWIKHYNKASLTINPQLNYDGDNYIMLLNFGFKYDF